MHAARGQRMVLTWRRTQRRGCVGRWHWRWIGIPDPRSLRSIYPRDRSAGGGAAIAVSQRVIRRGQLYTLRLCAFRLLYPMPECASVRPEGRGARQGQGCVFARRRAPGSARGAGRGCRCARATYSLRSYPFTACSHIHRPHPAGQDATPMTPPTLKDSLYTAAVSARPTLPTDY